MKCSIMLGDVVTARQAMEKAGVQQDQDSRSLETLERFKEETTNSINNKDYRRVGDLFIEDKILKYILIRNRSNMLYYKYNFRPCTVWTNV